MSGHAHSQTMPSGFDWLHIIQLSEQGFAAISVWFATVGTCVVGYVYNTVPRSIVNPPIQCRQTYSWTLICPLSLHSSPLQVRVTTSFSRPQQQCLGDVAGMVPRLRRRKLCQVLCSCEQACVFVGYGAGVIEMLLMLSGDVEPNPGPGEWEFQRRGQKQSHNM